MSFVLPARRTVIEVAETLLIALGGLVGSRFAGTTFRSLLGFLGAAFGSFAVAMSVATAFVLTVIYFIRSRSPMWSSPLRPAPRIR